MDAELQSALADAMRGESVLYACYLYEDLHRLPKMAEIFGILERVGYMYEQKRLGEK